MITRPTAAPLLAVLAGSLFSTPAAADTLKFASLPTGAITQHPTGDPPKQVPATERVPGFFVGKPPPSRTANGRISFVMIFATDKEARDFSTERGRFFNGEGPSDVCFSERAVDIDIDEPGGPAEWNPSLEPAVQVAPHFQPNMRKKALKAMRPSDIPRKFEVTAVHQERFVDQGNGMAQIDMVDAWVDPATRGARLIGRASLPLQKVGEAPGGLVIYGAKERTHVQLVIRRARPSEGDDGAPTSMEEMRRAQLRRMPLIVEASSGAHDASNCGFTRVQLHAEKGVGEMAQLETTVLTTSPPEEQPPRKDSPLQALLGDGDAAQDLTLPELRVRPLTIHLSTSWTSKDKEPVISVTMGWAGRDRRM
jgi:hypothetical protein